MSGGTRGTPSGLRLPAAEHVPQDSAEIDRSGLFGRVAFRRYEWEQTYSTTEYRDLLMTYSGHLALQEQARAGLLSCIGDLIDRRYGGRIAKRYLTQLLVAQKAARRRLP